jgi:ubiquinone biosynthesis protein
VTELEVGTMVLQLTRRAGEAGLRMDPELAMLGKTLLNLDQVAATLDPDFRPKDALRRHTAELMRSSMRTSPAALMASLLEAKEFVEALPGRVNRAFDAIADGHFEMRIKAFDEDEFLRGLYKIANTIASGVILAAMILASALLARSPDGEPTTGNRIALVVFVGSVLFAVGMLVRIALQTRNVRTHRGS